jgi:hypothetical protein
MKTIKSFVEVSHIESSLIRAVIRQVGGWESFKELAIDVTNAGANAGFSGFIYYTDTVSFTKRHKGLILGLAESLATDLGESSAVVCIAGFNCLDLRVDEVAEALHNPRSESRQEVFNALAWFALEEVCRSYADECDE